MDVHPAAAIFPMMTDAEQAELTEDIREHGLRVPIVLHDGQILDGRNRFKACAALSIKPSTVKWNGKGSPTAFVWSMNGARRHLTAGQRATAAVEMLPLLEAEAKERQRVHAATAPGRPADNTQGTNATSEPTRARDEAAAVVGVSARYVSDAKALKEDAPDLYAQVKEGKTTLPQAWRTSRQRKAKTEAADVQMVLDASPDDGGRAARAALKALYSKRVQSAYLLRELDPSAVAETLRDGDIEAAHWLIRDVRDWLDRLEQALGLGIRLVEGSR